MINYINQDITKVPCGVIAHGVNCQHAMGSGVAKAIRAKWMNVYRSFMSAPKGKEMLGTAQFVDVTEYITGVEMFPLYVANCYTQEFYGPGDRKYADIDAVRTSLTGVYEFANIHGLSVHLPKIGCGLGGLDWGLDVEPIVNELSTAYPSCNTYVYTI